MLDHFFICRADRDPEEHLHSSEMYLSAATQLADAIERLKYGTMDGFIYFYFYIRVIIFIAMISLINLPIVLLSMIGMENQDCYMKPESPF